MASDIHQKHGQSLFIPASHPVLSRQRSYSLPPGLALMSAEEATMMFSAAERATTRRRRLASAAASFNVEEHQPILESGSNSSVPSPEAAPVTPQNASTDQLNAPKQNQVAVSEGVDHQSNFSWETDDAATKADIQSTHPFSALPLFPASPTSPRPPATSPMLKTYADGIYEYTRSRLTTAVAPRFQVDSATSDDPLDHGQTSLAKSVSRPKLKSHFSDWSISTSGPSLSRQGSRTVISGPLNGGVDSPDPLFDFDFLTTEQNRNSVDASGVVTYASSEALVSSSTLPLPTTSHPRPRDDEVSYFSNFDLYLHDDERSKQPQRPGYRSKTTPFNLSPVRIRDASGPGAAESVGTSGGAVRDIGSSPSQLFRTAHLAVRVPSAMVRAIP